MNTDVLVVGAGPTGLMLANQLARRGVNVTVIDRNPGPSVQTKALGVQGRTLEIYAQLGIAARAVACGRRAVGANLWVAGRHAARVPLGDIGAHLSPYPFLLILGQDDNERLLDEALGAHGVAVQWNTTLVDLAQAADGVTATLDTPGGPRRTLRAGWIAGCDGPHSTVRDLCNIPFVGAPYEQIFYVADTRVRGDMTPDELNVYLWPRGFHLFFPMRGDDHWRVVGILPPALRGRTDLGFDEVAAFIRAEVGGTLSFGACTWFSTYRVHHRRAERFRDRRCFLLGDAAHIHSPLGAQGMNTGLQDAYNLGWKLALTVAGQAAADLLDSYEAERIPVAQRLLDTTDQAFRFVVSPRWFSAAFRTRVLPRALAYGMRVGRIREAAYRTISQIGIRYRRSTLSRMLVQLPEGAPRAGDRFPWLRLRFAPDGPVEDLFRRLDDRRFNLLLFGQSPGAITEPALAGIVVHAVPDDPGNDRALAAAAIPKPSFYLLRPDGHAGLVGARFDLRALQAYQSECLGLRRGGGNASWDAGTAPHGQA